MMSAGPFPTIYTIVTQYHLLMLIHLNIMVFIIYEIIIEFS